MSGFLSRGFAVFVATKLTAYATLLLILPCSLSAKSKKQPKPDWYPEPTSVYSPNEYIVTRECESGKNAEAAKSAAIDALARYVSTQVQSSLKASQHSRQETSGGKTTAMKESYDIERDILTSTDVTLYALETTDAYYDKATKSWYCAAFINRERAFEMIRSDADAVCVTFRESYEKAEAAAKSDMFTAIRQYGAAQIAGQKLLEKAAYASLFNNDAVRREWGDDIRDAQGIAAKVLQLKSSNPLSLTVAGDVNRMVFAAVQGVLQEAGFTVSDKSGCPYNVNVTVNTNIEAENKGDISTGTVAPADGGGMVLYASRSSDVSLSIAPAGVAAVYTFTAMGDSGKVAAYTKSRVEAKVCTACAEAVKHQMGESFARFVSGE